MSLESEIKLFYGHLKFSNLFFLLNKVMEKALDPSEAVAERIRFFAFDLCYQFIEFIAQLLLLAYFFNAVLSV